MSPYLAVLLVIVVVSALGGWLTVRNKPQEKPVKIMMFVGYFWLLAFVQLSLSALAYFLWHHF